MPVFLFLGASVGSFISLVSIRAPKGESLIYPPSKCDQCKNQLNWYDNIPIISWILLDGRCRKCKSKIAIRNILLEIVGLIIFGIAFFSQPTNFIGSYEILVILFGCIFFSILLLLTVIDIDYLILPRKLCFFGILTGLLSTYLLTFEFDATYFIGHIFIEHFSSAFIGLLLFKFFGIIVSSIIGKKAIGSGDAYLAAMIGAWLGLSGLLLTIINSIFIGGSYCSYGLLSKKISRGDLIPFGPFLSLGGLLVWALGNEFWIKLFY